MCIPDQHPPSSRRRGIMLAQPFDEHRLAKWEPPWIVQPKLDGERCRALITTTGTAVLLSSEENLILSAPHINAALERAGLHGVELDGELYAHHLPFDELRSRSSRTVNPHADAEALEYHIFDIVLSETQAERTMRLAALELHHPLHYVPHTLCYTLDEVLAASDRYIAMGYEGCVVRHALARYERKRSLWVMKWKPRKDDYYTVVGWKEEYDKHGTPKGRLGAVILMGNDNGTFDVGSGFTAEQREQLWAERHTLHGRIAHVRYQSLTPGRGVPRFPIFISFIDPLHPREE